MGTSFPATLVIESLFRNPILGHHVIKRPLTSAVGETRQTKQELQFEKCEDRNMLSASTAIDIASFVQPRSQQIVLQQLMADETTAYLQQGALDLQLVDSDRQGKETISVFQQRMNEVPVVGSFVTVTQGARGQILDVADRAFSHLATQDSLKPSLASTEAIQIANGGFHGRMEVSNEASLVWFNNGKRAELAWQVESIAAGADVNESDLHLSSIIDANTGQVLSQSQMSVAAEGILSNGDTDIYPRITIRDDIGAAGSRAYAAPFDSVVEVAGGCTGTLIATNVVLSARHCNAGPGSSIVFGDNSNAPVFTTTVQSSSLPAGPGSLLDGGDDASLTLNTNVPGATALPMRLIDATDALEGMTASLSGYGLNGLGSTGHQGSSDGFRWGGENVIDVYGSPASASGSNIISTDFDNPTETSNTIPSGSATPVQFEATTAGGDSGGAVFVQAGSEWLIAGVLSGGTTGNSVYGDISWWTGSAIYRAEIEAAGGVFADGGAGSVNMDASTYLFGDTIQLQVSDENASAPVSVTVTSDSGDSETIVLTGSGPFTGSIPTDDGAISNNDGTLQAADGDTITVTYFDADDGNGGSGNVTDTAVIFEPGNGSLVGVDFDEAGGSSPTNWRTIGGGGNSTFDNLMDENGLPTTIDLAIAELVDGAWGEFAATPTPSTIPTHSNPLNDIDGQIFTSGDALRLTYQDLTPGTDYEIYVLAVDSFFAGGVQQDVTITGDGTPVTFLQSVPQGNLFVNGSVGDSGSNLADFAETVTADANGEIVIDITASGSSPDVVLGGVAIQEVETADPVNNPQASKFLDGVVTAGSLTDLELSNDVYLQLNPSPTTNPAKQVIDVLLLSLHSGGPVSSFEFRIEAVMNGGPAGDVIQTIELWNEDADVWELVDTRAASDTETVVQVAANGDLDRFVNPATNEILSRVRWTSPGFSGTPFAWTVDVDQMGWLIA